MPLRPSDQSLLCELGLPDLSPEATSTLRRGRVFLYGISRPEHHLAAWMAGYTQEIHQTGIFRLSIVSGERPFSEWREFQALRPPRDPDLPDMVAALDGHASRWRMRALDAAQDVPDPDDRAEMLFFLNGNEDLPSRTWRAKACIQRLESLASEGWEPSRTVWKRLCEHGIEQDLPAFHMTLGAVQEAIRQAPVDPAEIEDIQRQRERAAAQMRKWLEERRVQLCSFSQVQLAILGLGEVEPPPGFEPPIHVIAHFPPAVPPCGLPN